MVLALLGPTMLWARSRTLALALLVAVAGSATSLEAQPRGRQSVKARGERAKSGERGLSKKRARRVRSRTNRPRTTKQRKRLRRQRPRRFARRLGARGRRQERQRARYEPHLHGSAVITGKRLVGLARRRGDLKAGLEALGLGHLPRKKAVKEALKRMSLYRPAHGEAYGAIRKFRTAAFGRRGYESWVRATVETVRSRARESHVQMSASEVGRFLHTARRAKISLEGFRVLVSVTRQDLGNEAKLASFLAEPEVAGIDILGPEKQRQSVEAFHRTLTLLLRSTGTRQRRVLRIHAGEGYLGEGGKENVNLVLRELAKRARKEPLGDIKVVLAHAARIADVKAASRDLRTLKARGVEVEVNVNPLSNLLYGAVERLDQIDALKLEGAKIVPGSDNVGSLRRNTAIVKQLMKSDVAGAKEQARPYLRLRDRQAVQP